MKQLTLILAAVFCFTLCRAQNQNDGQQNRPQQMTVAQLTNNMIKRLSLDDKQAKKIQKLNNSYAELFEGSGQRNGQRPPMGNNGNRPQGGPGFGGSMGQGGPGGFNGQRPPMNGGQQPDMESLMKEREKKQEKYEKKLKKILNDNQYSEYEKMNQEMKSKRGNRPNRPDRENG